MASRAKFPVYRGDKPYIFISYAHVDSEKALAVAEQLHRRRYRVWYDEGIEAGANWPEYIATHLLGADTVLFFPSEHFNTNRNCEREVNFSVDAKKKMVSAPLDDAALPAGLKMQLSAATSVRASGSAEETAERIIASGALSDKLIGDGVEGYAVDVNGPGRRINWPYVVGIVGILLAICMGVILFLQGTDVGPLSGGTPTPTPASADMIETVDASEATTKSVEGTTWSSTFTRDLLISQAEGDALYCCGNAFLDARPGVECLSGELVINDEAVVRGDISDLSAIAEKTNLVELALCYESITDVSALGALDNLTYLDLSKNEVSDIAPLTGLSQLATLKLSHTSVTDLTPALEMPALKKLYVSYDMADYIEGILIGGFEVIVTQ